jgi:peptidoglycan hydrolase CwlO-like protein
MKTVNGELKKVVDRVKQAQNQLQGLIKSQDWVDEARKYAERQSKEVKKLLSGDVEKVKTFLEKERKELDKFQKQIPGEVKKFRTFVAGQRKELEKLLANVRKAGINGATSKKKSSSKKSTSSKKKVAAAPATTTSSTSATTESTTSV